MLRAMPIIRTSYQTTGPMVLPDKSADSADFFPLPSGYILEPEPFSDDQIADLRALFSKAPAMPPGQAESGQDSGSRIRAA